MTERLEQQEPQETSERVSLTLWLDPEVVNNLNELVLLKSTPKHIRSKSSVFSELVSNELKATRAAKRPAR